MQDSHSLGLQYKLLESFTFNPDIFDGIENLVRPNIFTEAVTKNSYEIIKSHHDKGIRLDGSLLFQKLLKGGLAQKDCTEVASFSEYSTLSPEHIKEYVDHLFTEYTAKYLSKTFERAAINVNAGNDPIDEMNKVKDAINMIDLAINNVSKEKSIKTQFDEAVKRIKGLKSGEIESAGFSWGIPSLDEKTIGIVHGINVVAGDKGAGKSSIFINIISHNAITKQIPLLFFSLEMTAVEVLTNVIANIKRINSRSLRTGNVDDAEILSIEEIKGRLNDNFTIDETGGITWQYFESKVKAHRKKHKIPINQTILVLLDYLGLMKNSVDEFKMSKEEKMEQICTELMRVCKNENIALVKAAQFSREGSKRGNDPWLKTDSDRLRALRPRMSDLKGTSAIESNAITIVLLYRPEYYGIKEADGKDLRGLCELNVVKGRYVSPEPLYVKFDGKFNLFSDLEPETGGPITDAEEAF